VKIEKVRKRNIESERERKINNDIYEERETERERERKNERETEGEREKREKEKQIARKTEWCREEEDRE